MYMGLWVVDGFPALLVAVGILTHLCYGSLLSTFPVISLLSPGFIGGTCMRISHVAPVYDDQSVYIFSLAIYILEIM